MISLLEWVPGEGGVVFCISCLVSFCFSCKGGESLFFVHLKSLF